MRVILFICLLAALISSVITTPTQPKSIIKKTTTTGAIATTTSNAAGATAMHDCSVLVMRITWYEGQPWPNATLFDLVFYDMYCRGNWNACEQQMNQEVPPLLVGGSFEMPWGTSNFRVENTANPSGPPNVANWDNPGRVTMSWGNWVGKSWDSTTGCETNHFRNIGKADYICNFQCDNPL